MKIIKKKLTLEEFKSYVKDYNFGRYVANKLIIHHTWRPTKAQWNGEHSIDSLAAYYKRKGWVSGPHIFIAEDGIWLFTPMNVKGTHAGVGNWRSIGIEVVGDYDRKKWAGATKEYALGVIKILMERLKINTEMVKFHRDYSKKSCPGFSITKEWLFKELNFYKEKDTVPKWAKKAWDWCKEEGVVDKDSKPTDEQLRTAKMLYNYHNDA